MGKNKPLRFRPPMRVPSQRTLAKSRHITYRKMPPTHGKAVPESRPEEGTTDDGLYEEIPVPLYRNLHTSLGHVHHPAATRSLLHRAPERPRVPQAPPPTLRARPGAIPTTHSFSNPLSTSSGSTSTCGRSLTLGNAFVNEDRWRTFPRSSRPAAVYQNLNFSSGEVDTADSKSRCRGANPFSIEEWLEWWLEEERKVYSSGKKRMTLTYSDVVERPASSSSSSSETSSSDKTSDSGVDVDGSLGPRNSELRLTKSKSKSDNRISKLIQQFEKSEDDCELDVRLKASPEVIQRGSTTLPHPGPKDSPARTTRRPLPPKPSASLQPNRSWSAFEDDRLDGLLVSSRQSLHEGHFDGPVQAINPMYISQVSEATIGHRMLSSSRSSLPRDTDSISSLSLSTSGSFLTDDALPPTVMAPLTDTTNRRQCISSNNTYRSTLPKSNSDQVLQSATVPMRSTITGHVPQKASSSASAKRSNTFAPPLPVLPKPSLTRITTRGSDSAAKATDLEKLRAKCIVFLGEGEAVVLEQVHIDLMNEPWFHMITRKKAEMRVMNSKDGTFLIRPSMHNTDPLTLCLRYQGRTFNIPIRQRTRDRHFALGKEKANEMAFKTVRQIVETYHERPIKLHTGDRILLKDTPPKLTENLYVKRTSSA